MTYGVYVIYWILVRVRLSGLYICALGHFFLDVRKGVIRATCVPYVTAFGTIETTTTYCF